MSVGAPCEVQLAVSLFFFLSLPHPVAVSLQCHTAHSKSESELLFAKKYIFVSEIEVAYRDVI